MTLRTKFLLALVTLLAVTMFALMSIGDAWQSSLRVRQEADVNGLLAKRIESLNGDLLVAKDTLRLLAHSGSHLNQNLASVQVTLDRWGIAQSRFEAFYRSDLAGLVTPPYGNPFSIRDRDYFAQIGQGVETIVGPVVSRHTGQTVLVMFTPTHGEKGHLSGALGGTLLISGVLDSVLKGVPGEGALLAILGRDGQPLGFRLGDSGLALAAGEAQLSAIRDYLASTLSPTVIADGPGTLMLAGKAHRVFWREIPDLGWKIVYVQSEAELYSPMAKSLLLSRWLLVIVLLVGVLVIVVLERMIVQPVRALRKAHQRLEGGDYSVRVPVQGSDELSELSVSFNRTVEALGASEGKFAAIFDAFPHPVVLNRMSDGRYLTVNTAFEHESGLSRQHVLGMTSEEVNPSLDKEASRKVAATLLARGALDSVTVELTRSDGSRHWIMYSSRLVEIQGELCALSVTSDISALKQAEHGLRESQANLLALFQKAPIPMSYSPYREGIPESNWNESWYRTFGYPEGSCDGKGGGAFGFWCSPELRTEFLKRLREDGLVTELMATLRHANGSERLCEIYGSFIESQGNKFVMTTYLDVTDRRLAELALRASQLQLQAIFNASPVAMIVLDRRCNEQPRMVNRAWMVQFGLDEAAMADLAGVELAMWKFPHERQGLLSFIEAGGQVSGHEAYFRRADGDEILCSVSASRLQTGDEDLIVVVLQDITEERSAQMRLAESKTLVDSANDGMLLVEGANVIEANPAAVRMFGGRREDVIGRTPIELSPLYQQQGGLSADLAAEFISRALCGESLRFEWCHQRANGEVFTVEVCLNRIAGRNDRLVAVLRDITEQQAIRHALESSEARYRRLNENMLDGFAATDLAGRIVSCNEAFRRMLGYSEEALHDLSYQEITPTEWHEAEIRILKEEVDLRGYSELYEKEYCCQDGRLIPVELRTYLERDEAGQPTGYWALVRDISERKRSEAAADLTRRQLVANLENTPAVAVQWYDADGRVLYWNPASQAMYGFSAEEMVGTIPRGTLFDKEGFAGFLGVIREIAASGKPYGPYESDVLSRDGRLISVLATTFAIPMANGQTGFVCMDVDITARKEAERNLRELNQTLETRVDTRTAELAAAMQHLEQANTLVATNEKRLQAVLSATGEGVWDQDVLSGQLYNSARWYEILGLEESGVDRDISRFVKLIYPEDRDKVMRAVERCLQGESIYRSQHRMIKADGSVIWVQDRGDVIERDHQGHPLRMVGSVSDITAQKTAELDLIHAKAETEKINSELTSTLVTLQRTKDELVRSEKMAGLGSLVAGVAHELNTPIGNAVMVASTLADNYRSFHEAMQGPLKRSTLTEFSAMVGESSQILMRNLERAAHLISSFKQVAVDQSSYQRRRFDLREIVDEITLALAPSLRHSTAKLTVNVPEGMVLDSYPGPLGQVLMNLINNAMVHGYGPNTSGPISVTARQFDEGWIELVVGDSGKGIPAEYIKRVFDPFFTTRLGQGGSGLGLNIVYNLVTELLGGTIEVVSEVGKGALFRVKIPSVAESSVSAIH